jgi:AcrR family transcriptional regulator
MVSNTAKRVMPQRARKEEDKEARRRQLLDAALELYRTTSYDEVKMADVAERSKLAKGTVFLYFPTKEALFLALLEEQLFAWFVKLEETLSKGEGRWTGARVARTVAESLEGEEGLSLTRLLARLQTVLEQNVTVEQVRSFKEQLLEAVGRAGALVEKRLPFLSEGEGIHFFLQVHALVVGLRHMADLAPVVREVHDAAPHLNPLRVDFIRELTASLTTLLRGLEAR